MSTLFKFILIKTRLQLDEIQIDIPTLTNHLVKRSTYRARINFNGELSSLLRKLFHRLFLFRQVLALRKISRFEL